MGNNQPKQPKTSNSLVRVENPSSRVHHTRVVSGSSSSSAIVSPSCIEYRANAPIQIHTETSSTSRASSTLPKLENTSGLRTLPIIQAPPPRANNPIPIVEKPKSTVEKPKPFNVTKPETTKNSGTSTSRIYPALPNLELPGHHLKPIKIGNANSCKLKAATMNEAQAAVANLEGNAPNRGNIDRLVIARNYNPANVQKKENLGVQGNNDDNRGGYNKRGGGKNRGGRGGNNNNPNARGDNENRGNRGGGRGNRGSNRGRGNPNRGRNNGPGLLPTPGTSRQEMDWFNMAPFALGASSAGFTANDLPIRSSNYGGRYNDDARSESNKSNKRGGRGKPRRPQFMGFKKLEEIHEMEPDQIVVGLCSEEAGFEKLLKSELSNDYVVLVIRVISKCCQTTFQQNKGKILARVCQKDFIDQLSKYLNEINLHDSYEKTRNKYFWAADNKDLFWRNLLEFFEAVINLLPNTAVEVLPKLLKQTVLTVRLLETEERVPIPHSVKANLEELQLKLMMCTEEREKKRAPTRAQCMEGEEPPDDFRQISLYPTVQEITDRNEKVFLRANIIDGSYRDVDHYLDVHFRLLREDFVAPLRDGICQHLSQQGVHHNERKRIFNVRFYDNVRFISKYTMQDKVAVVIQLNTAKRRIKLENTRRFMYGSLVCFTRNNFQSIVFGTVMLRDRHLSAQNQIAIDLTDHSVSYEAPYTMVECNVFFDPYYNVLKALQTMSDADFPLKRYIIHVEPEVHPPKYLKDDSLFEYGAHTFYALQKERWPSAHALGLDTSQYRAFQAALTKEFCVIQGPPGTGKTYIGLKITQVLLKNRELWNTKRNPILVICYTNHALDQFLEGIIANTQKVVRIGGQSKNDNLKFFNIREVRRKHSRTKEGNHVLYNLRNTIKNTMGDIQRLQRTVNGIVSCDRIVDIHRFEMIDRRMDNSWFAKTRGAELLNWLMGGRTAEERYQERRKQKITEKIQQQPVAPLGDKQIVSDSEDELYDPEEEAQRQIDDFDFDFGATSSFSFGCSSLLTHKHLQEQINMLEKRLTEITAEAQETNDFTVFDERGTTEVALNKLYEDFDYFNWRMDQLKSGHPPARPLVIDYDNPNVLSANERWGLYAYWLNLYRHGLLLKINELHEVYRTAYKEYEEVNQIEDINLMRDMRVVGMTTSGAARYQTILQALKCPIVIVEEAAEVLESHVVVSLTSNCQQLILIGDHKQLRPTTAEYRLQKHCHLDVSLFERMVTNRIHCETLEVQHRMRPEIVKLIVPAIYPKLDSHPTVYTYPPVMGLTKNLFFVTHTEPEEAVDDSGSRRNVHEARFMVKLARHLVLQGYEPQDITILAAYSGQMFCMWKERKAMPLLQDVRITGVDNYQGEENKIILLSLVRSNADSNIGFLRTDNRVNVALSRAKEGLYIIGNMSILEKSDNAWPKIKATLEENHQIGPYLTLQCQVHDDQLTNVRTADDFLKVTEGGCSRLCGNTLNCGHICGSLCHVTDREHTAYKCKERCTRGLCEIGHPCPDKCFEECRPCQVPLSVTLKCGHQHYLPCHMNDTSNYPCPTLVDTQLECGHVAPKPCHRDVKKFACPHECDVRKLCGHACDRRCHIYDDPDHLQSRCFKKCARPNKACTQPEGHMHVCRKACFEECAECEVKVKKVRDPCGHVWWVPCRQTVDDVKCTKRCKNKLTCGHDCKLECWQPCGRCDVKLDKIIESCGHKVKTKCSEEPDRSKCGKKCPRPLACGHPCNKKCNEPCRTSCMYLVDSPFNAACGHQFKIPCSQVNQEGFGKDNLELLKYCQEPCRETLQCEHKCAGTCGACAQGRIHAICREKCGATLICGHECEIPCREICQPCNKKCYYKCAHNKCGKKCGEPCAECKEPCKRRCIHGQCNRLCSEPCSIPPCNEPCPRLLRCKHPCIGFCGEPCPPVCRACNQDDETFVCFFGAEDEPDSRFVYLEECGHTIEADAMDTWMRQKPDVEEERPHEINVKRCPKCKTIIMTSRYSEYIKQVFKDIIAIKRKVYLEDAENVERRNDLQAQLATLRHDNLDLYKESKYFEPLLKEILTDLKETTHKGKRNPVNTLVLQKCSIKIHFMQRLVSMLNKGALKDKPKLHTKSLKHLDFILSHIVLNESRTSQQKIKDVELEISRFEKSIHLFTIEKNPNFAYCSTVAAIKTLHSHICKKLESIAKYTPETDAQLTKSLEELRVLVDKSISITEEEKRIVVHAVGLAKGRWFKCPNGHYFVIGECGGATEIGRCNECGEAIGGRDHALLATNRFAGEMDGATHPAWSNATNLANYALNF